MTRKDALARAIAYHQRTKHRVDRFARALGYLDWATQPDPFRRYRGARLISLDEVPPGESPALDDLDRPGRFPPPRPLERATLSQLLYDSLALSAWKRFGDSRWSLRVNPSSGNLHPTEGYLLCDAVPGVSDGPALYHYAPYHHGLELRFELSPGEWAALTAGLPPGSVLFGLTSIHWRESWKYGERAYRYCQHDAGHAIGAVALAAAAIGWRARLLDELGDDDVGLLLGVHRQRGIEAEHPDGLLALFPDGGRAPRASLRVPGELRRRIADELDDGAPNELSRDHHEWPIIDDVAGACRKPDAPTAPGDRWRAGAAPELPRRSRAARPLIRRRRSAVAMDGATGIERDAFYRMLQRLHPALCPFTALPWRPAVHLAIFVHRVRGLEPGLYLLVRDETGLDALRAALRPEFRWTRPPGCPDDLDLWVLALGPCDNAARSVSCNQDIAADGAFALGMIAEFEPRLAAHGPWFYRALHWETGVVGQVLYLEAEAAGVSATGIGCFLDDLMHELLGLDGIAWQTLYHFTVGRAVEDERLATLDAYEHLPGPARPPPAR